MTLARVWTPSPNYSYRSTGVRLVVLHTTEGFTGPNGAYDCAHYFQGNVGASAHVCIDNYHPGKVWEGVQRDYGAWTQCGCNSWCVAAEQCGYASYSRDKWLSEFEPLLRNTAAWVAEECARFGIPVRWLSASEAQSGAAGVTQHSALGGTGCGHSDCGSGYPYDKVIEWAKGGGAAAPEEVDMIPGMDVYGGKEYYTWVKNGTIMYRGPDTQDKPVCIDSTAGARGGTGLRITADGWTFVTFTNNDGDPYVDRRPPGGGAWERFKIGDG